jgi:hypothetical protein
MLGQPKHIALSLKAASYVRKRRNQLCTEFGIVFMSVEHGNLPTKLSIGWFMDPACPGTLFQCSIFTAMELRQFHKVGVLYEVSYLG